MNYVLAPSLGADAQTKRYSTFFPDDSDVWPRFPTSALLSRASMESPPTTPTTTTTTFVPITSREWRSTLAEIKKEFMNRRFRECVERCREILSHDDKFNQAHPVHLVYLHFYAATSIEMQARSSSSRHRITLLKQAHEHYSTASRLAVQADVDTGSLRPRSSSSTTTATTTSTSSSSRVSSPSPSLSSLDDTVQTPRRKKRVTFCDEPVIRPDSPTLGFDESSSHSPSSSPCTSPSSEPSSIFPESILKPAISPYQQGHAFSRTRFYSILATIQHHITTSMARLDDEITAACCDMTPSPPTRPASPNLHALDIRARIERLRARGWNRPRFDAQRYQILCQNANAEIRG